MKLSKWLEAAGQSEEWFSHFASKTEKENLAAVKQDGTMLRYVNNQSETVCLAAVKENGYKVRYVDNSLIDMD